MLYSSKNIFPGAELTVSILGDEPLPVIEIRPHDGFYDYHHKYTKGMTDYLTPAPIEKSFAAKLQEIALDTFKSLGCKTFGRVDFRVGADKIPYCLEVNTIPGMTETSLVPKAAAAVGISFKELRRKNCRVHSARQMILKNLHKSLKGLRKRTAVVLLILSVGLVYTLFDSRGLIQRIRLESEKSSLENKIRALEQKNASMQAEIEKLKTNDQEIERIAREKYFMHRNGEKIIKVQPK